MENQQQSNSGPKKNQVLGIVLILAILAIVIFGIYNLVSKEDENKNTNTVVNQNINTNTTNQNTNLNENINSTANNNTNTQVIDTSDWLTYTNDKYKYTILYPSESIVSEAQKNQFSLSSQDIEKGLTFDDVYEMYTGKICITINYRNIGYIQISAPENDEAAHMICGRTGVGATLETIKREVTILIDGKQYTMSGHEFIQKSLSEDKAETLNFHNETLVVTLDDKTRIEIGSGPSDEHTFSDYLKIKDVLFEIVKSYQKS